MNSGRRPPNATKILVLEVFGQSPKPWWGRGGVRRFEKSPTKRQLFYEGFHNTHIQANTQEQANAITQANALTQANTLTQADTLKQTNTLTKTNTRTHTNY